MDKKVIFYVVFDNLDMKVIQVFDNVEDALAIFEEDPDHRVVQVVQRYNDL